MKKTPENLADPRILLTEAGEQQWLNEMLNEATAQQQDAKKFATLTTAAKRPATPKRPRKAA